MPSANVGRTGLPDPSCTDRAGSDCAFWAMMDECEKNPEFMISECASSCHTCDKAAAITAERLQCCIPWLNVCWGFPLTEYCGFLRPWLNASLGLLRYNQEVPAIAAADDSAAAAVAASGMLSSVLDLASGMLSGFGSLVYFPILELTCGAMFVCVLFIVWQRDGPWRHQRRQRDATAPDGAAEQALMDLVGACNETKLRQAVFAALPYRGSPAVAKELYNARERLRIFKENAERQSEDAERQAQDADDDPPRTCMQNAMHHGHLLWHWWCSNMQPAGDPHGAAYRDAYLVHIFVAGVTTMLWQAMTRFAADEAAIKNIAQPYTCFMFVIVITRVVLHESASAVNARTATKAFGISALLAYVIVFFILWKAADNSTSPLQLVASLGAQISANPINPSLPHPLPACTHDGQWIYVLELVNMLPVGLSVGVDLYALRIGHGSTAAVSTGISILFTAGFLLNTLRERGPGRLKCGFHAQLSPLGLTLFIAVGWLAFIIGLRVGAARHRRGLERPPEAADVRSPSGQAHPGEDWDLILTCSITCERFVDPVLAPDGHTYERAAIEQWLRGSDMSPMTGQTMPEGELRTAYVIRSLLQQVPPAAGPSCSS